MSIEWVLAILISAQAGLLIFHVQHILACNKRDRDRATENQQINTTLATITATLHRVEQDIGTHETGIRGALHKLRSEISPYIIMAQQRLERDR